MADKEKKRKRQSGKAETPNKKAAVAVAPAFSNVAVKYLEAERGALGPVVVSAPGISAPEKITFKLFQKSSRTGGKRTDELLLHSSTHPRLDYIAQEEQLGQANGNLRHYVGVYDSSVGEFTVTEVHKVTLRSALRPTQEELDEEAARSNTRLGYVAAKNTLGQEFGTKRAKKAIADYTDNAITLRKPGETAPANDAVTEAMLESLKSKTVDMLTAIERQEEVDKSKPRPEANLSATTPAGVYALDTLIPAEDLAMMKVKAWEQAINKGEGVTLGMRYVARRLQRVATGSDDATKMLKVLKYLNILLTWYKALDGQKMGGKKVLHKDKLKEKVDAPPPILEGLRKFYADGGTLSKWHLDRLITYICAITLHIDNFETDVHDLQEDLMLDIATVSKYFHELGCSVSPLTKFEREVRKLSKDEAATHRIAKLKLPLEFPKTRMTGASKRR